MQSILILFYILIAAYTCQADFAMQSKNYNKYYVGRKNGNEAWIIEDLGTTAFKKFKEVQGLYRNPDKPTASREVVSIKRPNDFYLRHRNFEFFYDQPPVNDAAALQQFKEDASFTKIKDGNFIRLESENFPGYFMRHQGFRLKLDSETSDLFIQDSSFEIF